MTKKQREAWHGYLKRQQFFGDLSPLNIVDYLERTEFFKPEASTVE